MPGPSGPSPKLLGRVIAITLALIFVGVVWWAMSRGTSTTPRPTGTDFSDAPDITDVEKGESIVLTLADRDDPTRVAGVIEADRLDPVGNGERLLTNPRAWLYMDNNRAVRVTADRARLLMPVNETPESGTLEGSVRVRVYESDTPGTPPADTAEPILTATFDDPVRFERRYMRLSSPGAFTIDSEQVRFSGEEMTVMLNEVRRRLESLDVARNGRMEISIANPDNTPDTPADEPDPQPIAETAPPPDPAPPLPAPTPPKIDLYHTVLTTAVNATIGDTQVDADRLELFTRLTNNTLPPTAIARIAFADTRDPVTDAPNDEPDAQPTDPGSIMPTPDEGPSPATNPDPGTTTTSPDPSPAAPTPAPDRLVLTWTGPMSIRPIDNDTALPAPLAADDAALLLHADPDNTVRLADSTAGITAQSASLAYYATRAHLHLDPRDPTEDAPTPDPVQITMQDTGAARLDALRADLRTGRIDLPGPGTVASDDARIDWTESAALTLFKTDDDRLTSLLRTADFTGAVDASQADARIAADALATEFTRTPDNRAVLTTATITRGSISADPPLNAANTPPAPPAPPRSLAADTVRVDFNPASPDPDPTRVEATGAVRAAADGATLTADHAVAHLMRDARNQIAVRTADAAGAVRYAAADDTRAEGDTLAVNAEAETVRITGPDSMIAQGDSTVRGPTINLDARARRMTVEGAGRFEHTLRDAEGLPAGRVLARWADSMRFDDALGRLHALGDVSVVSTPDAYTRDTLSAQRIEVEITPQPIRDSVGNRASPRRELHTARAFGDSGADSYRPATAETRRYDPNDPERVTGLLYLEGDQITADNRAATLRVPGAGTLLVMDRRDENAQPEDQPDEPEQNQPTPNTLGPGLTRFTWRGAFDLDRAAGVAIMDDQVLVRHKTITPAGSPNASQIAELSTDTLTATFAETDGADNPFTLRTADAQGSVRFLANDKQLSADAARFEADTNTLHALALPGRLVELREPNRPAPLSARAIQWDLARDRIEINRPSPVTLPN